MSNKYLKPMLDVGSPRVFNCNLMTRNILAKDPEAPVFFRNKPLNALVLIKDTVPEADRRGTNAPRVGTKLFFPFNKDNIYEGGRTIFLHDRALQQAIFDSYGEGAIDKEALTQDLHIMTILNKLPSLDPFLLKDVFIRYKIDINPGYFEVSDELWNEIEQFMLQRFEPLVKAAFPDAMSSDEKARQLIDKIWEARDLEALQPLIDGFRLPQHEALDIFSSWRGIVYYSYQYQRDRTKLLTLVKWLKENESPVVGVTAAENKELQTIIAMVKDQIRIEWQRIESIVTEYQDSYDKMFKEKSTSTPFLTFLRNSNQIYWDLGNSLGKTNHAIYCWTVMTARFADRKLPWQQLQAVMKLLGTIFQPEKKTSTNMTW